MSCSCMLASYLRATKFHCLLFSALTSCRFKNYSQVNWGYLRYFWLNLWFTSERQGRRNTLPQMDATAYAWRHINHTIGRPLPTCSCPCAGLMKFPQRANYLAERKMRLCRGNQVTVVGALVIYFDTHEWRAGREGQHTHTHWHMIHVLVTAYHA